MKTPRSAAIYARISSDQSGEGLGVTRQLEDCRELAANHGWTVGDEYVDNDISAYKGKPRPQYQRMLDDLAEGYRDAVIVYNMDRLTRQPMELEQFSRLCEQAGVTQVKSVTADIDLGNDDGLFMARILAAIASKESGRKSERLQRKARQLAEQGLPNGGHHRPFGYEQDRMTVNEAEAEVLRQAVGRFLAGESSRSICVWLNNEGVQTTAGGPWQTVTLNAIFKSGRIAGLREHKGVVVADAQWPGIITPAQRQQILGHFETKKRTNTRAPRRYVLSGLLRCGKCGNKLFSSIRVDTRRYVCLAGPDHGGCGRLTIVASPVEEFICAAVLMRLDTPEMADALTGRRAVDERQSSLLETLEADRSQMQELSEMWAAKDISSVEWKAARDPIEARIRSTERQLAQASSSSALDGLIGTGEQLMTAWSMLNLDRQAAIIKAVLDYATILPGTLGARTMDPARIQPVWQL
ncbi:recombinase family protein [Arthrobacter glacialis]|uniref:recombinase family protein n=1 Tax=Arthrobacter glacialis TaxID=1664 RepID=UPI000CD47336|nr:recombinase family protein [Arthrobacter glacialis]POH60613.1 serine recombinase [Arthrobacter glacialis]